jgi:Asp/Glu/hydantoin racemase
MSRYLLQKRLRNAEQMATGPRIALIHATPVAMGPIAAAFAAGWPEAELANILDDSLTTDRARERGISPALFSRFSALIRYALDIGAHGILFTCSAFGPAIDRAAACLDIPVMKPNEAMFETALGFGRRIGMLSTFAPSTEPMETEFVVAAAKRRPRPSLTTVVVPEAMQALRAGDVASLNRLVAAHGHALAHCDAVMLAQFSTARALAAVEQAIGIPVLTAPDAAVAKLRRLLKA